MVDPSYQLESSIAVSLLAVAHWVVAWQRERTTPSYVPHWITALHAVLVDRIASSCTNKLVSYLRTKQIFMDDFWVGLFQQAIELLWEEEGMCDVVTRPP